MLKTNEFLHHPLGIPFARTSAYSCLTFDLVFRTLTKGRGPTIYLLQKCLGMQGGG